MHYRVFNLTQRSLQLLCYIKRVAFATTITSLSLYHSLCDMLSINIKKSLLVVVCLIVGSIAASAQEKGKYAIILDTNLINSKISFNSFDLYQYFLYQSPSKQDELRYKTYKALIKQEPTIKNYKQYYALACSLWELNKLSEAENLFLTIINSTAAYYTATTYHPSDVAGYTTPNRYGYGSYTSNYKNTAAIYLSKIYITQEQYDKALLFLDAAVHKYAVTYTCGTGFNRQKDEYDYLYAACYEGLNRHKDVIDLLLPTCLDRHFDVIVTALKNTYSQNEIENYLKEAEASIECSLDSFPSYSYVTRYTSGKKQKTDTITYYSGSATMMLFGRKINMAAPPLNNGEHATKELFLKLFRETLLYSRLKSE